jgi:hypothetical protein
LRHTRACAMQTWLGMVVADVAEWRRSRDARAGHAATWNCRMGHDMGVGASRRSGRRTSSRLGACVDQRGQRRTCAGSHGEDGRGSCFGDFPVAASRGAAHGQAQRRCQDMAAFSLKQKSGSRPASSCTNHVQCSMHLHLRPHHADLDLDLDRAWRTPASNLYATNPSRMRSHLPDQAAAECRRRRFVPALPSRDALGWSNSLS